MDAKLKNSVCASIYRQFPEVRGVSPQVKSLPAGKYQFVFNAKVKTEDGKTLTRTVRAVSDENGKILKLTTSR
ncbi:MAG: hypothetical protein KBD67_02520 [Anaerolineaceae bacterium]|nr:hypothetical protein [Anaerolineaceae bacterium]